MERILYGWEPSVAYGALRRNVPYSGHFLPFAVTLCHKRVVSMHKKNLLKTQLKTHDVKL